MKISDKVVLRKEEEKDYLNSEAMTREAFWNVYHPGCSEHFLITKIRLHESNIPELSIVAEVDGKLVGSIYYTESKLIFKDSTQEYDIKVATFGPLAVDPEYQNNGIGFMLIKDTLLKAEELGYKAIFIYGNPEYYGRFGFVNAEKYGISTEDGKNFDAFMCLELKKGALKGISGRLIESEVFKNINVEELEEYDSKFPEKEKKILPGQLGV
ncbi:MAG: N-acetyltransferase [Clostridiaceae bacterium]